MHRTPPGQPAPDPRRRRVRPDRDLPPGREVPGAPPAARPVVVAYRLLVVALVLLGMVWIDTGPDLAGLDERMIYFTLQSNLLLAVVLAWAVAAELRGVRPPPAWLKGGAAVFVTITGVVYNALLNPGGGEGAFLLLQGRVQNDLLHVVVPLLAVVDVLLWDRHGRLRWNHAALWLLYPLGYLVFVLLRGAFSDGTPRYPYAFVDVERSGYEGVAVNAVVLTGAFWLLGLLYVGADHLLARVDRRRRPARTA
ncbi:hypothetical protein NUM3379_35810 [Kineococcus sp. NUM-3379]